MTTMDSLKTILDKMNTQLGATGSAVVSKNGIMMASKLPPEAREETFGLLAATIFGASEVAYTELGKGVPLKVVVESEQGRMIVANAGAKAVLVITGLRSPVPDENSILTDSLAAIKGAI